MDKCKSCGKHISKKHSFCPKCGTEIERTPTEKSKPTFAFLTIFISCFTTVCVLGLIFLFFNFANRPFSNNPRKITKQSNSVVMLECYTPNDELYSTGSGFAVFEEDIIVTNYHVIKEEVCRIVVKTEDGHSYNVNDVITVSKPNDIAILRLEEKANISVLKYNSSHPLTKGEKIVAIGSPLGLKNTVSNGIISGYTVEDHMDILQFTAPISSGSSGGALFNDQGEVIGITYASYESGQNLNLAIPIKLVESLWVNKDPSKIVPVKVFYESEPKKLSVSEVFENYKQYLGKEHYIEGYVSFVDFYDGLGYTVNLYLCSSPKEITNNEEKDKDAYKNGQRIHVFEYKLDNDMASVCSTIKAGDYVRVYGYIDGHELIKPINISLGKIEKLN